MTHSQNARYILDGRCPLDDEIGQTPKRGTSTIRPACSLWARHSISLFSRPHLHWRCRLPNGADSGKWCLVSCVLVRTRGFHRVPMRKSHFNIRADRLVLKPLPISPLRIRILQMACRAHHSLRGERGGPVDKRTTYYVWLMRLNLDAESEAARKRARRARCLTTPFSRPVLVDGCTVQQTRVGGGGHRT